MFTIIMWGLGFACALKAGTCQPMTLEPVIWGVLAWWFVNTWQEVK